ncbi:MAG: hypothetical protein M3Q70_02175 [bacterium]|nr:hypothetical protein [bacterium]
MSDLLPGEATAAFKVEQYAQQPTVRTFVEEYVFDSAVARERFMQVLHGIGFAMFQDGLQRAGMPKEGLTTEQQAQILKLQTDLFLQGVSALSDEIRGI